MVKRLRVHLGNGAVDAQGLAELDRLAQLVGQRLDGLEAALGRAGQQAAHGQVAQLLEQAQGFLASLRRQRPRLVGALPLGLLARMGMTHEIDHGHNLPMTDLPPAACAQLDR